MATVGRGSHREDPESTQDEKYIDAHENTLSETTAGAQPLSGCAPSESTNTSRSSAEDAREKDVEKGHSAHTGSEEIEPIDPNIVDWDGADDPANPLNWKRKQKWSIIAVLSAMTFITYYIISVDLYMSRLT